MSTMHQGYEVHLRGALDDGLGAFLAEYDLGDLPVDLVLHGLRLPPAALWAILDRAETLGVAVVDVRFDASPPTRSDAADGGAPHE
jgi:hypothetical protein